MIQEIKDKLKEKNINDTSINKYIRDTILLNGNKDYDNLNFLKDIKHIDNYIENNEKYKITTKRNYYNSLNVILSLYPKYNKLKEYYYDKFDEYNNKLKLNNGKISDDKKDKYIEYPELLKILDEYKNKVDEIKNKDILNKNEFNLLLEYLTLSLYLLQPPRRNKDYLNMYIIKSKSKLIDNNKNYLIINKSKFIFNDYKTAKIYNQ